ncbi:DUF202 domain-containing protein [Nocardia sp. CA-151230]|uniref:DUF202 domain-containing protein n=1 Tax=Nocardia sp. CA-151230 TaxID=3239982 RepID=UPI003D903445
MSDTPRDPGLQAERTALAWRRTAASAMGGALVLVHFSSRVSGWQAGVGTAASAAVLLVLAVTAHCRGRRLRTDCRSPMGRAAPLVSGFVVVAAFVLALVTATVK